MTCGPVLFARFAYPPNALGYCGPADSEAVRGYAGTGTVDAGLVDLAERFTGAWPYLQLIAAASRITDPLDARVVHAYWVGGPLLERVGARLMRAHLEERFRRRIGGHWADLTSAEMTGARAHHNFHVFAVYPWVGLLRAEFAEEPLRVLDRCRIRWGRVEAAGPETMRVRSRPLVWDGLGLALGAPRVEEVLPGPGVEVAEGDVVALHWDWICHRLDASGLAMLRHYTMSQMALVNAAPRPAPVLDRGPRIRASL
ncbi:MAG TPA: DUF6390 family protein [Spirillospora sp.]|nr:DUF6390 family protein [Spirillospora sp.]